MKKIIFALLFVAGGSFALQAQTTEKTSKTKNEIKAEQTAAQPQAKSCCASKSTAEGASCADKKNMASAETPVSTTANAGEQPKAAGCCSAKAASAACEGKTATAAEEPKKKAKKGQVL